MPQIDQPCVAATPGEPTPGKLVPSIGQASIEVQPESRDTNPDELEMQRRERENLLLVLQKTDWKIKGADGAAELLGVKPTTLLSRVKKMGLRRPA